MINHCRVKNNNFYCMTYHKNNRNKITKKKNILFSKFQLQQKNRKENLLAPIVKHGK